VTDTTEGPRRQRTFSIRPSSREFLLTQVQEVRGTRDSRYAQGCPDARRS